MIAKHDGEFKRAVFANANRGGENVHSGIVMGAAIGAATGAGRIPKEMKDGLHQHAVIEEEIASFVSAVLG